MPSSDALSTAKTAKSRKDCAKREGTSRSASRDSLCVTSETRTRRRHASPGRSAERQPRPRRPRSDADLRRGDVARAGGRRGTNGQRARGGGAAPASVAPQAAARTRPRGVAREVAELVPHVERPEVAPGERVHRDAAHVRRARRGDVTDAAPALEELRAEVHVLEPRGGERGVEAADGLEVGRAARGARRRPAARRRTPRRAAGRGSGRGGARRCPGRGGRRGAPRGGSSRRAGGGGAGRAPARRPSRRGAAAATAGSASSAARSAASVGRAVHERGVGVQEEDRLRGRALLRRAVARGAEAEVRARLDRRARPRRARRPPSRPTTRCPRRRRARPAARTSRRPPRARRSSTTRSRRGRGGRSSGSMIVRRLNPGGAPDRMRGSMISRDFLRKEFERLPELFRGRNLPPGALEDVDARSTSSAARSSRRWRRRAPRRTPFPRRWAPCGARSRTPRELQERSKELAAAILSFEES